MGQSEQKEKSAAKSYRVSKERVIEHLREMIRIRTVSHQDDSLTDKNAFRAFRALLKERYPAVFAAGEHWEIGDYGLLIRIPGEADDAPSVLMAHMDVVDADETAWEFPPFEAVRKNGMIHGRGSLDTKCTLCAVMESCEYLCRNRIIPKQDLYISFGGEEELPGKSCPEIVAFLEARGVRPGFVLDEGGAVIPEGMPGFKKQAAMVGIAEKGVANYRLTIRDGCGGHASVPPRHTVAGRLAKAAVNIEKYRFPVRLSSSVEKMFHSMAELVPAYEKPVFRNPKLVWPAIAAAATALGSSFNAMVRTTAAITLMEGGAAYNVLPDQASIGINARLIEGDTIESVAKQLKKAAGDPDIQVEFISGSDPTPVSETDCGAWKMLRGVIEETWPGTPAAPYQMNGGTDGKYYAKISPYVYRFTPMVMTKEERAKIHGIDEAVEEEKLMRMVKFYIKLVLRL